MLLGFPLLLGALVHTALAGPELPVEERQAPTTVSNLSGKLSSAVSATSVNPSDSVPSIWPEGSGSTTVSTASGNSSSTATVWNYDSESTATASGKSSGITPTIWSYDSQSTATASGNSSASEASTWKFGSSTASGNSSGITPTIWGYGSQSTATVSGNSSSSEASTWKFGSASPTASGNSSGTTPTIWSYGSQFTTSTSGNSSGSEASTWKFGTGSANATRTSTKASSTGPLYYASATSVGKNTTVLIGLNRVRVGALAGTALVKTVTKTLQQQCNRQKFPARCSTSPVNSEPILYEMVGGSVTSANGTLSFIVHNSTYNNDYELDGMINIVAESMASVAVNDNCRQQAIDSNNDEGTFCSAPNSFGISILNDKGTTVASMSVAIKFILKTPIYQTFHQWNCTEILPLVKPVLKNVATQTKWKGALGEIEPSCASTSEWGSMSIYPNLF